MLQLKWTTPNKEGTFRSEEMPFGHYTIFSDGEWWAPQVGDNTFKADNPDEAKLACQADLEERTLRIVNAN